MLIAIVSSRRMYDSAILDIVEWESLEKSALVPEPLNLEGFDFETNLPYGLMPYGLKVVHVRAAMQSFLDFIGFINEQLATRKIERLEAMLMPANFSSIVGEFMNSGIPRHCPKLVKNRYHNGHPDLIPAGEYSGDAVQHADRGIEIKASRYLRGWQGHNPEDAWLMVFMFDSNRPDDAAKGIEPKPFRFLRVAGAQLSKEDWTFSGRSATSRRTITASVNPSGYANMMANRIYEGSP